METILADKEAVTQMIPQAEPMVMIDRLINNDENTTASGFEILPDNVFCEGGFLSASGLTENIAQTAAARGGYRALMENAAVNIGFIGAVKKLKIHQLPKVGQRLETRIEVKNRVLNFSMVVGHVYCEGQLMAECDMRIYEKTT